MTFKLTLFEWTNHIRSQISEKFVMSPVKKCYTIYHILRFKI